MGVFNGAQYLRDSIQSILDQEGIDLELIIVNDGSSGETREILARFAAKDSRVQCSGSVSLGLDHGPHKGLSRRPSVSTSPDRIMATYRFPDGCLRKWGFSMAIRTWHSHPVWTEFCGPDGEFLYCGKGTGVAITPRNIISEEAPNGLADGPTCHPSVMMRRSTYLNVGGYRPQFYFGQDWDLWYRLAEAGGFQMVEQVLYRARVTPNSLSGRYKALQERIAGLFPITRCCVAAKGNPRMTYCDWH